MKINDFQGDLTDISAEKEALERKPVDHATVTEENSIKSQAVVGVAKVNADTSE